MSRIFDDSWANSVMPLFCGMDAYLMDKNAKDNVDE
jgi:hypothetical protein